MTMRMLDSGVCNLGGCVGTVPHGHQPAIILRSEGSLRVPATTCLEEHALQYTIPSCMGYAPVFPGLSHLFWGLHTAVVGTSTVIS